MDYRFKIEVSAEMIHRHHVKGSHLLVLGLIEYFTRIDDQCVYSVPQLAAMLDLNPNTVYNAISSLENNNLIVVERDMNEDGHTFKKIRTIAK